MRRGAILLVGGESRRMGRSKALLPFGDEPMCCRLLRILQPLVETRVVVAAPAQPLPPLPEDVLLVHDQQPGRGPLEGIRSGLEAACDRAELFFVCACDTPLLQPALVERLFERMRDEDAIVVPRDSHHFHPLVAVYRKSVAAVIGRLLDQGSLRTQTMLDHLPTQVVDVEELRDVDRQLFSFRNVNGPEEYQEALRLAQFQDEKDH